MGCPKRRREMASSPHGPADPKASSRCNQSRSSMSDAVNLGRDWLAGVAFERRHYGVPGEDGAFDSRGEFVHASENSELAKLALRLAGGDQLMYLIEHLLHVLARFAFHGFG